MQENNHSLNLLYLEYREGHFSKKEFEEKIFQCIIDNYDYFSTFEWSKEQCIDFMCWFYPRLSRSIETYQETGASFDTYISTTIRWSMKEYLLKEMGRRAVEYSCWKAVTENSEVYDSEPDYPEVQPHPQKISDNPRQLMVLLLKSYYFISEDYLTRIAPSLGIEKDKLSEIVKAVQEQRLYHDEKLRDLKERIHSQYYRCISYEKRLNMIDTSTHYYERMKKRLYQARCRLEKMRKRLAGVKLAPSNQQIANVLGISKGTVDSTLYTIRKKYRQKMEQILKDI
ncbi:MAG: hypothetical protein LBQ88_11745 [Treponema sp.]|jgi:DNA-directed RNA polymerase specialized sigma24 family protein|nr:hypothetical protein [Treponema sp.]